MKTRKVTSQEQLINYLCTVPIKFRRQHWNHVFDVSGRELGKHGVINIGWAKNTTGGLWFEMSVPEYTGKGKKKTLLCWNSIPTYKEDK